jgi:thiamine biosynthesis lipoprotein
LALGVGVFVVAALPSLGRRVPRLVRRRVPLMGTIGEVGVVHADARAAHAAIDRAFDALRDVEARMSRFLPDSDVGRANARAAFEPVRVGEETAFVLERALALAEASGGRFDPCLGRAVALWDVTRRTAPPAADEVRRYAGRRLHRALRLERGARGALVRFEDEAVAIDLGGIAKGHGVDRAVAALRAAGVEHALVNVGGDLRVLGERPGGGPWRVGVRDPLDGRRIAETFDLTDGAVATSGDAERFFEHGGRRYHHILDAETGAPRRTRLHSATVRAPTCLEADGAATLAFLALAPAGRPA